MSKKWQSQIIHPLLLLVIACGVFIAELVQCHRYRSLKHIRGPPVPSWVFGMLPYFACRISASS